MAWQLRLTQGEGEGKAFLASFAAAVDLVLLDDDDEDEGRYWPDSTLDTAVSSILYRRSFDGMGQDSVET